jgi:hypothetical protein
MLKIVWHKRFSEQRSRAKGSYCSVRLTERLLDEVPASGVPVQSSEYVAELFYGWTPASVGDCIKGECPLV